MFARNAFGLVGKTDEHEQGTIESDEIGIGQAAQMIADVRPRDGGDLVHHDAARLLESGSGRWLDGDSRQRRVEGIGCQGTDRD